MSSQIPAQRNLTIDVARQGRPEWLSVRYGIRSAMVPRRAPARRPRICRSVVGLAGGPGCPLGRGWPESGILVFMRVCFLLLACLPAMAVPVVDCPPPSTAPTFPQPPGEGGRIGGLGTVFLLSPPGGVTVPRNAELILRGSVQELSLGFWSVVVTSDFAGEVVPSSVVNDRVLVTAGLLPADSTIHVTIEPTQTNPCQGCFGTQEFSFSTNDVVDTTAPLIDAAVLSVNGFVLPTIADQQACGDFGGALHAIDVVLAAAEPTFVTIAARGARTEPTVLLQNALVFSAAQQVSLSLGNDVTFNLGEAVVVVLSARDMAGNVSAPRVLRLRMRSFLDRSVPDLLPLSCELAAAPDVFVPSRLPNHPALRVVFAFEDLPLALRLRESDGPDIPLVAIADIVEDARIGHVYQTARSVDAGAYDVVAAPCLRCRCPECNAVPRTQIIVDDVVDERAPSLPAVRSLLDYPSPALSVGRCQPDQASTLLVLSPGDDDVSAATDLMYDAVIRLDDGLPRPAGTALQPWQRANGDIVVGIPSGPFGRLIGSAFTLTLSARDAAGRVSQTTYENSADDAEAEGCATTPTSSLAALLVFFARRRRRFWVVAHKSP